MESILNESAKKRTRGHNAVRIDSRKLDACLHMRGLTWRALANALGTTPTNAYRIKKAETITEEHRAILRNILGIPEEDYVLNAVQVSEAPQEAGTQDLSMAAWAQHVAEAKARNARENAQEEVILLRREELREIVREAVLDVLKRMVGGAVA